MTRYFKRGIGKVADAEFIKGKTDEEALAEVRRCFPDANTTIRSIESHRSRLRSKGYSVPTSAEARRKPHLRLVV